MDHETETDTTPGTWAPTDAHGRPLSRFGPEHILSTTYIRNLVRNALSIPEESRAKFWRGRRSFAARRLYECGLEEAEVIATLVSFHRRVREEAHVRKLLNRIEAEVAQIDHEGGG